MGRDVKRDKYTALARTLYKYGILDGILAATRGVTEGEYSDEEIPKIQAAREWAYRARARARGDED